VLFAWRETGLKAVLPSAFLGRAMTRTTCHMSISLDGFVAGADPSRDNPLGVDGLALHHWHLDEPLHPARAHFWGER
jgi:hypothetical protein